MRPHRLLLLVAILCYANPALALRCSGKLVRDGDPKAKVLKYCGDPVGVEVRTIYRQGIPRRLSTNPGLNEPSRASDEELLIHRRSVVEVSVEEWTYNFGPRRLMRIVRFENGLVTEITQLGYGYQD